MIATLIVVRGEDHGKVFRVFDGESRVVGRGSHADIILQDAGISRQHFRIRVEGDAVFVNDLNSRNGTFVNRERIRRECRCGDGAEIEAAHTVFKLTLETMAGGDSRRAEPPAAVPAQTLEAPPLKAAVSETVEAPSSSVSAGALMGAFEPLLNASKGPQLAPDAPADDAAPERLVGRIVAGCRIVKLTGRDPISVVFRGHQISMDRPVAVKVLSSALTRNPDAVHRFIEAARAGGRLNHPNIVQVLDAGEESGLNFVILEHVEGESVQEICEDHGRRRPMEIVRAVDIAAQIAEALEYAHARSCIHRSITPDAILVTVHGIAKLANLGLVRSIEESGIEPLPFLRPDVKTIPFTAPEILKDPRTPSPLSDLYSLGAVLFFMLTGSVPFRAVGEKDLLDRVLAGRREPIRKVQRNVPDELAILVESALAPQLDHRPVDAGKFAQELRHLREWLRSGAHP